MVQFSRDCISACQKLLYSNFLVSPFSLSKQRPKVTAKKTKVIRFRATDKEASMLDAFIAKRNASEASRPTNRNQVLQSLVRNCVGLSPDFLADELAVVKESNRNLLAIGRNLNQVIRRIHSGEATADILTIKYLNEITARMEANSKALSGLIKHCQKRGQTPFVWEEPNGI